MVYQRIAVKSFEIGLRFVRGEFDGIVLPGVHWVRTAFPRARVDIHSRRDPFLTRRDLDTFVRHEALASYLEVIDLSDGERALVWVDGRFQAVLEPGLYAYWTGLRKVTVQTVSTDEPIFTHEKRDAIAAVAQEQFDMHLVPSGFEGVLFVNGEIREILPAGRYLVWKSAPAVGLSMIDTREQDMDIHGQDIMTADKVTVRVNANLGLKVRDVRKVVSVAEDARQVLYREAQLALREAVGSRTLSALLEEKVELAPKMLAAIRSRGVSLGYEVLSLAIRDLILPGEMKELLNRVTEARAAAEANLITRREETAAMRSQANTAKMLEQNPTLMRLKELEIVERVSENAKLQVVLGERGLADRIVNLI